MQKSPRYFLLLWIKISKFALRRPRPAQDIWNQIETLSSFRGLMKPPNFFESSPTVRGNCLHLCNYQGCGLLASLCGEQALGGAHQATDSKNPHPFCVPVLATKHEKKVELIKNYYGKSKL